MKENMKIVQINTTCGIGSTGKICVDISKMLSENHIENYILYSNNSNGYPLGISCSDKKYVKWQALKSHVIGNYGFNSKRETRKIIEHLNRIKPDIVHLHNIHGHDCDLDMLFQYFKENKAKLIWTFHDCWAFTGYCTYFTIANCDKWKQECKSCEQCKEYSFLFDRSRELYHRKKELFSNLDLTIVTPSKWLAELVKESMFKDYPIEVINNGIDLDVFKPTYTNFREKYNIPKKKKIILGVAFDWGIRKGIDVFTELSNKLNSEKYQIVLVGTNEAIDRELPKNIISIHRTKNQTELAEIYTAADFFVNPTREENYPTVNMEAIACGTPVFTFDTGGSPESIDSQTGVVVHSNTVGEIVKTIEEVSNYNVFNEQDCTIKAREFDKNCKYKEYLKLYETRQFL